MIDAASLRKITDGQMVGTSMVEDILLGCERSAWRGHDWFVCVCDSEYIDEIEKSLNKKGFKVAREKYNLTIYW